ncbi:MAG: YkgJ family cysteine cluster protein [Phycisphaerae bacterium]
MGSILCEHCTAACCRYVAVPLDKPRSRKDYDDIQWYLMHEGISVFVEDGDWYIQFQARCRNLGSDNMCTIYASRPRICRDYEPGGCDYVGGTNGYDRYFTHPKQVQAYYEQRTGKKLVPDARRSTSKQQKAGRKAPTQ